MLNIEEPTREDHIYRGRVYRYVVWAYSRVTDGFEVIDRTDFYDHAKNVAERVPAVYNERPGWIHELKDHDKKQASTKKKTTMTNEQVFKSIQQIPRELAGVFCPCFTVSMANACIDRLVQVRDNLLAAKVASCWLNSHGFKPVEHGDDDSICLSWGEFCAIAEFPDDDHEKNAWAREVAEIEAVGKVATPIDKHLFVLSHRVRRTSEAIDQSRRHLNWLESECEDAPNFIKQMEKKR